MVLVSVTVRHTGLSPDAAAKAWFLRVNQEYTWGLVQDGVLNSQGQRPSAKILKELEPLSYVFHLPAL